MRYFKLISTFTLPNGNVNNLCIIQQTLNAEYDSEIEHAILNARVTAKRMCNGVEPVVDNTVTELTSTQYNALLPASVEADLGDATELQNELGE